jgi:predicted nucleic acid-binding protein
VEEGVILVDTNAWIRHLQRADSKLVEMLLAQRVRTCDVVIGELLLGSGLPETFGRDLMALPRIPSPTALATREFIERHHRTCAGAGIGWADAQIVLAAHKAGTRIYTSDAAVRRVARGVRLTLA